MMTPELVLGAAVVTANRFNPSVISQIWLVNNGITGEKDFGPTCIFSPEFVQVGTTTFNLSCTLDQLQFAPVGDTSTWGKLTQDGLGKILQMLPHTPFTAIGVNFVWRIRLDPGSEADTLRRAFAGPSNIYRHFAGADARFGAYLSRDYETLRLRVNIVPILRDAGEAINLSFNFQKPVADHAVDEMLGVLSKWDSAVDFARRLCDDVYGGVNR